MCVSVYVDGFTSTKVTTAITPEGCTLVAKVRVRDFEESVAKPW